MYKLLYLLDHSIKQKLQIWLDTDIGDPLSITECIALGKTNAKRTALH